MDRPAWVAWTRSTRLTVSTSHCTRPAVEGALPSLRRVFPGPSAGPVSDFRHFLPSESESAAAGGNWQELVTGTFRIFLINDSMICEDLINSHVTVAELVKYLVLYSYSPIVPIYLNRNGSSCLPG